jgi:hypothetical protein
VRIAFNGLSTVEMPLPIAAALNYSLALSLELLNSRTPLYEISLVN